MPDDQSKMCKNLKDFSRIGGGTVILLKLVAFSDIGLSFGLSLP